VARWLVARGATLKAVARRDAGRGLPGWARRAGARLVALDELSSTGQSLLLVATPDGALAATAATLAERPQAAVALHLSGALGAAALAPLRAAGCAVGSLHPLRAFPRTLSSPAVARRTFFALDGDPPALALGARLAAAWGAPSAPVPGALRPLYHLAATWAAGGTSTLVLAAATLHQQLGLPAATGPGLVELARGALGALTTKLDPGAITGPVARGEEGFLAQLAALRERAPEQHPLAVLLALETLRQLARAAPLGPSQVALARALREHCARPGFLDPLSSWV
jgi:predicted short-subunit dehydrogenase-like oxidoreductase (DUF2520 family)